MRDKAVLEVNSRRIASLNVRHVQISDMCEGARGAVVDDVITRLGVNGLSSAIQYLC